MSLRDDLLPVFNDVARQIPVDLGLRTHTVKVKTRTWSAGETKLGTATTASTTITPAPKVRQMDGLRSVVVGPITPDHSGGGYTPAELLPSQTGSVEVVWTVTGPDAVEREYTPVRLETQGAFGYLVHLESLVRANPF